MNEKATLQVGGKSYDLDVITGSENEKSSISRITITSGYITMDPGYGNTGSCSHSIPMWTAPTEFSAIAVYLSSRSPKRQPLSKFAYLILYGELPKENRRKAFSAALNEHAALHTNLEHFFTDSQKMPRPWPSCRPCSTWSPAFIRGP